MAETPKAVDKQTICAALPFIIEALESLGDLSFVSPWGPRAVRLLALGQRLYCGGSPAFAEGSGVSDEEKLAAEAFTAQLQQRCEGGDCKC